MTITIYGMVPDNNGTTIDSLDSNNTILDLKKEFLKKINKPEDFIKKMIIRRGGKGGASGKPLDNNTKIGGSTNFWLAMFVPAFGTKKPMVKKGYFDINTYILKEYKNYQNDIIFFHEVIMSTEQNLLKKDGKFTKI